MMNSTDRKPAETLKEAWAYFKEDMQNPVKRKVKYGKILNVVIAIVRSILLCGLCFVILMPFIQKISYAFRYIGDVDNPLVVWIPEHWSVLNFKIAFKCLQFDTSFIATIILCAGCTVLQVIATSVAGYAFARLKFKGSNILFYIILFSLVVPNDSMKGTRNILLTNSRFIGMHLLKFGTFAGKVSIINAFVNSIGIWVMTAFGMGLRSVIFIFLFRQFFRNVPVELEESAQVDGATVIQTFTKVMFPNARGTIITVALFAFVWQYNDSYYASLFGMNTISTWLGNINNSTCKHVMESIEEIRILFGGQVSPNERQTGLIGNTAALAVMVPLLIAYFFVQKQFVESIERTGLTGM